jgi:hypothetical protein
MKSALRGKHTSAAEVTNVSGNGFWILLDGDELFVAFKQFPWFKRASIGALLNVKRPAAHHLHWPELDVDLAVESLTQPEKFPLVSKERPNNAFQRTHSRVTPRAKHGSRRAARR